MNRTKIKNVFNRIFKNSFIYKLFSYEKMENNLHRESMLGLNYYYIISLFIHFVSFFLLNIIYLIDIIRIKSYFFLFLFILFSIFSVFFGSDIKNIYEKKYKKFFSNFYLSFIMDFFDKQGNIFMLFIFYYFLYFFTVILLLKTDCSIDVHWLDDVCSLFFVLNSCVYVFILFLFFLFFHLLRHMYRVIDDYLIKPNYFRDWGLMYGWRLYMYASMNRRKLLIFIIGVFLLLLFFNLIYFFNLELNNFVTLNYNLDELRAHYFKYNYDLYLLNDYNIK